MTIDLLEGEQRVLQLEGAAGRDLTTPGREYAQQLVLRVVKVLEGAAVLEYGPVGNLPATDS